MKSIGYVVKFSLLFSLVKKKTYVVMLQYSTHRGTFKKLVKSVKE